MTLQETTEKTLMGLAEICQNLLKITQRLIEKDDELEARIVALEDRLSRPQDNVLTLIPAGGKDDEE